jgi:protein-S-isoprenylcysteine O-methyltransferase Ste14
VVKKVALLLLILISTGVWFGLAVLGEGGFAVFLSHDALLALIAVGIVLIVVSVFSSGNLSSGEREDRGNRWVLVAFTVIGLLDGWLPAWADRNEFWIIDGETVRWIGVVLFAVGGALRIWPVFVLGYRFSGLVAIQAGHTLVTTGIYRSIRNPSYLGVLVLTLGWGLAFRSGVGVVLTALFIPPLVARMNAEEALLRAQFGEEYEAYRSRTSRLIPGVY